MYRDLPRNQNHTFSSSFNPSGDADNYYNWVCIGTCISRGIPRDLCKKGNLEGVKAALQRGVGVNTKEKTGKTGLVWAVEKGHNSVVALLLDTPNIDLNLKTSRGGNCALLQAVRSKNNEASLGRSFCIIGMQHLAASEHRVPNLRVID